MDDESAQVVGGTVLLLCMYVPNAYADVFEQYGNAKNAFDAGEYEEAVRRFEELLDTHIQNPALVLETYKLLGISYLFLGKAQPFEAFTNITIGTLILWSRRLLGRRSGR